MEDRLREHAIQLLMSAGEQRLTHVIRALENPNLDLDATPREDQLHVMDDDRQGLLVSTFFDDVAEDTGLVKNNVASNLFGNGASVTSPPTTARGKGAKPVQTPMQTPTMASPGSPPPPGATGIDMNMSAPAGDDDLVEVASSVGDMTSSVNKRGNRRIGISAVPVAMSDIVSFEPKTIPKGDEEKVQLRKALEGCTLFSTMDESEREIIVNAMDVSEVSAGTDILTQGEVSVARFYLIFDGTVAVVKGGKNVATMGAGQTFGELEMMYDSQEPNGATVRAVTDNFLYWIDRPTYKHIVLKVATVKRELYGQLLSKVSFLEAMTDYDKNTLADALSATTYMPGDYIIRFADKGQWLHFIVEGEVQVVGREKGAKVDIIRLGVGEPLGELEFLFNHLTVADVVAVTKVKTAKMSRKHFDLCMGEITDDLKRAIAKGKYEHYLKEADAKVIGQLDMLEKKIKAKRTVTRDAATTLEQLDRGGELIVGLKGTVTDQESGEDHVVKTIHRFPMKPVQQANFVLIGLREDGSIVSWNKTMRRITNYSEDEVKGQYIYTFLLNPKDQKTMHHAIGRALQWAGDCDGYFNCLDEAGIDGKDTYTLARSDGLTKTEVQLQLLPPCVAQQGDTAEMLLGVGLEIKNRPPQKDLDNGAWLAEQLREQFGARDEAAAVSDGHRALEAKVEDLLGTFDSLQQRLGQGAELRPVNVRLLIGQFVSNHTAAALEKDTKVVTLFGDALPDEIYCDTEVYPEILKYGLNNAVKHCEAGGTITIRVDHAEEDSLEHFQVSIEDNGATGISTKVIENFKKAGQGKASSTFKSGSMNRVRTAASKLGGSMAIESNPGKTVVRFRVPFLAVEDDEDDNDIEGDLSLSVRGKQKLNFTSLVVEERPMHRNMLCAFLWERKHAVLPAMSYADIVRLVETADIIIVDPQQEVFAGTDAIAFLREKNRTHAVIVTCDSFDDATRSAYATAGFFTLTKPCTAVQAAAVFRKAEEKIAAMKAETDKIVALRAVFDKTQRGQWTKGKLLGKGAFGEVFEAVDVLTGGKMAVKMLRLGPNQQKEEVIKEIEVMCTLHHENIIHYFYCEDVSTAEGVERVDVFMELAPGGTLQEQVLRTNAKGMAMEDMVPILKALVAGIAYTHSQRFIHCDLKTANVLFGIDGKPKIGDFGTAKRLKEDEQFYIMQGTPIYMSPECMSADPEEGVGYDFKADIWSLGCMVMEMSTGRPPWSNVPNLGGPMGIFTYITDIVEAPDLSILFDAPPSVFEFVRACLSVDPEKRPTAAQLLDYALLRDEGEDADIQSAMKALKRAQLIHTLNRFVAFYDEDDGKESKAKEAIAKAADKGEGGFFDSDDEDEDEDEDGEKPPVGGGGDFFDSDDEDEDAEEEEAAPKKAVMVPPVEISQGVPDEHAASAGASPGMSATAPLSMPANPKRASVGHGIATEISLVDLAGGGTRGSLSGSRRGRVVMPAEEADAEVEEAAAEEAAPPAEEEPKVTAADYAGGGDTIATQPAAADEAPRSNSDSGFRGPTPPKSAPAANRPIRDHTGSGGASAAIMLHDALLVLIDNVKRSLSVDAEVRDSLHDQYAEVRARATKAEDVSADEDGSPTEVPRSPASERASESRFDPDVMAMMRSDADVINKFVADLQALQGQKK
jgi:serine/threonine protein kinase/CRP-like cAMP-binding protein